MKRFFVPGLILLSLIFMPVFGCTSAQPARSANDGWGKDDWGEDDWGDGNNKNNPPAKPSTPPPTPVPTAPPVTPVPPSPPPAPPSKPLKFPNIEELWAKLKVVFPKLPLPDKVPPWALAKLKEALEKKSFDPLIEAYCYDKSPDKESLSYRLCVVGGKALAKAQCVKVKGKVEEVCKQLGDTCNKAVAKATIKKLVELCEKTVK